MSNLLDQIEEALEPFARFAEKAEQFVNDRASNGGSPIMPTKDFRLADFARAKAALALVREAKKRRPTLALMPIEKG